MNVFFTSLSLRWWKRDGRPRWVLRWVEQEPQPSMRWTLMNFHLSFPSASRLIVQFQKEKSQSSGEKLCIHLAATLHLKCSQFNTVVCCRCYCSSFSAQFGHMRKFDQSCREQTQKEAFTVTSLSGVLALVFLLHCTALYAVVADVEKDCNICRLVTIETQALIGRLLEDAGPEVRPIFQSFKINSNHLKKYIYTLTQSFVHPF